MNEIFKGLDVKSQLVFVLYNIYKSNLQVFFEKMKNLSSL